MKALNHWAEVQDEHGAIMSFIEWLESEHDVRLDFDYAKAGTPLDLRVLVDSYCGVDREALEIDRRNLIDKQRAINEKQGKSKGTA